MALMIYNSGAISSSRDTIEELFNDMWRADHPAGGVDDPSIIMDTPKARLVKLGSALQQKGNPLIKNLISKVLKSEGNCRESFDYDAMGTPFFKTNVDVQKMNDKYLLGIYASYVGNKPEKELAEKIKMDRSLVWVQSSYELSKLTDGWIGLNLHKALNSDMITDQQIADMSNMMVSEYMLSRQWPTINVLGTEVELGIGFGDENNPYIDKIILDNGNLFAKPKDKPFFSFSMKLPGNKFAVTPEQKSGLIRAKYHLNDIFMKNML